MEHDDLVRYEALHAAFLWWTAVVVLRAVADAVCVGVTGLLAWSGGLEAGLLPLTIAQLVLPILILWTGACALLRPGGLVLASFWRRGWVAAAVALVFLGAFTITLSLPMIQTLVVSRFAPLEAFAEHATRLSVFGSASALIHTLTFACVFLVLALRVGRGR